MACLKRRETLFPVGNAQDGKMLAMARFPL
jgi:hypothetical protein